MIRLTQPGPEAQPIYVNPAKVCDITVRRVRDQSLDVPAEYDPPLSEESGPVARRIVSPAKPGFRNEGCHISYGGPEDSGASVMESAEDVARLIEEANRPQPSPYELDDIPF